MNIEQEKMIVESLSSLYPLQEFEEKAIDTVLNAIPHCIHAGDIEADCPKWKCDNPSMDCENCEFLKEYKKEVTT